MIYNELGQTGLKVTKVSLGCASLGNEYGDLELAEGIRAVHVAIDRGINFFDTSPYYGRTLSETRLGKALKGKRDKVILGTKGGRFDIAGFDFSYDGIIKMCEESLVRLQTDYIDVYQLHDIEFGDKEQVINEAIPAMHELKRQGKVRFIGVTGFPVDLLAEMVISQELDVALSYAHFTLVNQTMHDLLQPHTVARNVGLINASITGLGLLTHNGPQPWHPASQAFKDVIAEAIVYCTQKNINLTRLAVLYALKYDGADSTLLGTRTVEELENSLKWMNEEINQAHLDAVLKILEPIRNQSWE
ncbi:MAG: aldo/keto reductase [Chloroflexota bacterium]